MKLDIDAAVSARLVRCEARFLAPDSGPLVGPEDFEAAQIEDEIALVGEIPGLDLTNFRPDRNAAAGGALPKVAGTTRQH